MSESGEWPCEHWLNSGSFFKTACREWNYCPICGAKRPEEPKRLWEKMRDADYPGLDYGLCADTAKKAFLKVITESTYHVISTEESVKWLRKRVEEM